MRVTSLVALAIVVATDALYVAIINSQGSGDSMIYVPRFVASYLAVMAALTGIALLPAREIAVIRVPLRAAAAAGMLVMGLLAEFSVGAPLVIAGILVGVALSRTERVPESLPRWSGLLAALLSVAMLVGGFAVTERIIECPQTGSSEGAGSYLLGGAYHYTCRDGQLHWTSG